jgi:hypothetical protein
MLVDFELGRLSARRSAAVEQHVRSCEICQQQGLGHAVTERRRIIRKLDRVRPTRRLFSRQMRGLVLILVVAVLFELVVFELLTPDSALRQMLGGAPAPTPTQTQPPATLVVTGLTASVVVTLYQANLPARYA